MPAAAIAIPFIAGATGISAAIGTAAAGLIGATIGTAAATAIGTGIVAGGITALRGGDVGDVLKSAVLGGVGSYAGGALASSIGGSAGAAAGVAVQNAALTYNETGSLQASLASALTAGLGSYLTPIIGQYAGDALGIADAGIRSTIGSAVLAGGITAARGGTVSDILTTAATGALANQLGQFASNIIGANLITNPAVTQESFEDALFAGADAAQLRASFPNMSEQAIRDTLIASGLNPDVATTAAAAALSGSTAEQIAAKLSNDFGGMTYEGKPTLYVNGGNGAYNSVVGGASPEMLERVQRLEDGDLLTTRAQQTADYLRNQGQIGNAMREPLLQDLISTGADRSVAQYVVDSIVAGTPLGDITSGIIQFYPTANYIPVNNATYGSGITGERPAWAPPNYQQTTLPSGTQVYARPDMAELEYYAADAQQMAQQGLGQEQIRQILVQSGMSEIAAIHMSNQAANLATYNVSPSYLNQTLNDIASQLQEQNVPILQRDVVAPTPVAPAPAPAQPAGTRSWNPISSGRAGTEQGYITQDAAGRDVWTSDDGTLQYQRGADGRWDRTPVFDLSAQAQPSQTSPTPAPGGNVTEAEFIAADAAQLAAQTGNNAAAVQQNLQYAGVDPAIAAQAANMAVSGATADQIAQAIAADVNPTAPAPTPAPAPEQPSLGSGITAPPADQGYGLINEPVVPPGYQPGDLGSGITAPTYPSVPGMGGGQGITVPGVSPEAPAPLTPTAPTQPGGTPAQIGGDLAANLLPPIVEPPPTPQAPNYGTFTPSSPDPSWSLPLQYPGMNPGLVGAGIRPAYQTTSPVQAQYYWGRQPYFATPQDMANYNQTAMPQQPWGIQQGYFEQPLPLPQIPVYGENMFVQPQPQQFAAPATYAPSLQPMPQQMMAPMMMTAPISPQMIPNSPYVYNIAPTASQYSVPGASPV